MGDVLPPLPAGASFWGILYAAQGDPGDSVPAVCGGNPTMQTLHCLFLFSCITLGDQLRNRGELYFSLGSP